MAKIYFRLFIAGLFIIVTQLGNSQSAGSVNGWFDAAEFLYNNSNANPNNDVDFYILQYDSGYYWLNDSGAAKPFNTFAAGHIFDLKHDLWSAVPYPASNPIRPFVSRDPFVWDSLRFNYFYMRGSADTSITDTLFIYYYCNFDNHDTQITTYLYVFGTTDSMRMASPQPFNYTELSGKYFKKDTVLLSHGDTAGIKSRRLYKTVVSKAFNGSSQTGINHSNLFGYSLVFKPGAVNSLGDTLFDHRNSSAKANVFGVYYTRFPEPGPFPGQLPPQFLTKTFTENSFLLDKNNRYGGTFLGTAGFTPALIFYPEHYYLHAAAFITGKSTVATNEVITHSLKLWPNPVSPGEVLNIEAGENLLHPIKVVITNILGKQVFSTIINQTDITNYSVPAPLPKGMYMVTITGIDNNSPVYTTKLVVAY